MDNPTGTPTPSTSVKKSGRTQVTKVTWREHAVQIDLPRSEVDRVHVVDTDFVIILKSKRRVMLRLSLIHI